MAGPAEAWWGSDAVELSALYSLTAGVEGYGPETYGTLDELYSVTGDYSTCPAYLAPQELPQIPEQFDQNGFALDGAYSNREPVTELVDEALNPRVYLWADSSTLVDRMDSQSGFYEMRLMFIVRVRRNDNANDTPGGYGVSVSREFAQRESLNLCRAIAYLLSRDLPRTCRTLSPADGFGVSSVLQTEAPVLTPNYGADGDMFADAIASVTVLQLRAEPANTGV
jgi:hypothetical protein